MYDETEELDIFEKVNIMHNIITKNKVIIKLVVCKILLIIVKKISIIKIALIGWEHPMTY